MTKLEREGLDYLTRLTKQEAADPAVNAAVDWIQRQISLDDRRRRKRGNYRKR